MIRVFGLFLAVSGGPAMADLQSCKDLFAAAPQVLSDLNEGESHIYEDENPGLGYSISFVDPSSKFTVFFYDYEKESISAETALASFKQSARDMRDKMAKDGSGPSEFETYELTEQPQLFRLRAEAVSQDGVSQLLALGVVNDCIVKVRFTAKFAMNEAKVWMSVFLDYLNKGLG